MYKQIFRESLKICKHFNRYFETNIAVLTNGVRVAVEETYSPLVCISLFAEAGPRFETIENNGITHFIEHMAYKGFKNMTSVELDNCLYNIGAQLNASTSREIQIFSGKCTVEYTAELMSYLSQIVNNLEFSDYEIQLEKDNILKELIDNENCPKHLVFNYLHQAAYQGTSLAQRVIGPMKNIKNFDAHEACCYMCERYVPENLVLAVSGAVQHVEIISHAQKRFTHICPNATGHSKYELSRYTGSSMLYRDDSMPYAHVAIAVEVPGFGHFDYWSLLVANCILGSWDKSMGGKETNASHLAQAADVSHICEFYEPFYITYRDTGLWGLYFVAEKMDLDDFVYNIQQQWMHLCIGITNSEVERGINLAKLTLAKDIDNSVKSCNDIGLQMLYTGKRLSLSDKFRELDTVSVKTIRDIGDKYIYDRCPVISAIGPTEGLPDYSRLRANMYWLKY